MNWEKVKVFVSGIDGFLGAQIARELLSRGAEVGGTIHNSPDRGRSGLLTWGIRHRVVGYFGDVTDETFLATVLEEFSPQWIFHFAAQPIVIEGQTSPFPTFDTNIKGTYNLLCLASRLRKLRGIIVASTDKAYGYGDGIPYVEDMPLQGGSIYETSKACVDLISQSYAKWFGLPLCITRCANIYGPGDLHLTRIIPETIHDLAHGRRPIIRSSGLHERDFIYIDDAVSGHLKLAEYLADNPVHGEAFNFGTGTGFRIVDVVQLIIDNFGSDIKEPIIIGNDNPAEIIKHCVDATKAKERLGWRAQVSMTDGLRRTVRWYTNYFDGMNRDQHGD